MYKPTIVSYISHICLTTCIMNILMHTYRLTCVGYIMFKTVFNFFNPRWPKPACTRYMQTQTLYQHHNNVVPAFIACRKASRSSCPGNLINQEAIFPLLNHAVYFQRKRLSSYSAIQSQNTLLLTLQVRRYCLLALQSSIVPSWANNTPWMVSGLA